MPCQDYSGLDEIRDRQREEATVYAHIEQRLVNVLNLLEEMEGEWPKGKSHRAHFSKKIRRQGLLQIRVDKPTLDKFTAKLCATCKKLTPQEISKFSLELQIWWRDHQEDDIRREEEERRAQEKNKKKKIALSKLTSEEKKLLNVKE